MPDSSAARRVVAAYFRSWVGVKNPIRFLKQAFRLEKVLVASPRAMRGWVLLIRMALGLYTLLLGPRSPGLRLVRSVESFSDDITFRGYRLARALAELLESLPKHHYRLLLMPSGP